MVVEVNAAGKTVSIDVVKLGARSEARDLHVKTRRLHLDHKSHADKAVTSCNCDLTLVTISLFFFLKTHLDFLLNQHHHGCGRT